MRSPTYLHLMSVFPALTETFVLREVQELRELGWNVTICQLRPRRNVPLAAGFGDLNTCAISVRIISLETVMGALYCCCRDPGLTWSYFKLIVVALWDVRTVTKLAYILVVSMLISYKVRHDEISHVRGHHLHSEALAAMFTAGFLRVPYSFTAHTVKTYYPHPIVIRIVRGADFIVAISDQVKEFLYSLGAEVSQVHLIRNSVKVKDFLRRTSQGVGDIPIVLAIGRLDYKKGFHVLLSACHSLRRFGLPFHCVIVGDGHERSNLLRLRTELHLEETVEMLGSLEFSEVSRWLDRSAVLAVPSVVAQDGSTDGLPTVIIEAFAKGVPVVGTRTAAIPEIIKNGINGFLVAPNSPEELALRLAELLERQDLRDQFSIEARQIVECDYNLDHNVRILAALILGNEAKQLSTESSSANVCLPQVGPIRETR